MDTDSMYVHIDTYNKYLGDVKDELGGGKNDYGDSQAIIYARFVGSK